MAENSISRMPILYGDLDLRIIEARSLPNMDLTSQRLRLCFTACETCVKPQPPSSSSSAPPGGATVPVGDDHGGGNRDQKIHHRHPKIITSDPYVTVSVPHATLVRTRVMPNSQNPNWDEHYLLPLAHPAEFLEFRVKDNDVFGAQTIGTVRISAAEISSGEIISGWFPVMGQNGKQPKPGTALRLEMKFTPAERNPLYQRGIPGDPEQKGVRNTYFPMRRGHSVITYHDAHISDDCTLPKVKLDGGTMYEQQNCWEDLCYAITEAHHLIYIVGWSVYHKIKLVREPTKPLPRGGDLTLGELLKYKSEEGVRVLLLIWDDKTSHDKFLINTVCYG